MGRVSGATLPAEMWKSFMVTALKRAPRQAIPPGPPAPIVEPAVDAAPQMTPIPN